MIMYGRKPKKQKRNTEIILEEKIENENKKINNRKYNIKNSKYIITIMEKL
ncbi:MAG: hypothetical protein ACOC33_03805 [bacterium]